MWPRLLTLALGFILGLAHVTAALAGLAISPNGAPYLAPSLFNIEGHISQGQSWRDNCYLSFGLFGINPQKQTLLAGHFTNPTTRSFNGPLSNGAGVSGVLGIDGVTSYSLGDCLSIGRAAVLTQQILRSRDGTTIVPILEFCAGYPASTWSGAGLGGGLEPGPSFTGTVVNNVLTPSGIAGGIITKGQQLVGADVPSGYYEIADNGDGTWTVGKGQTVISEAMTTATGSFTGSIGGAAPNTTLDVDAVASGDIEPPQALSGNNLLANTKIVSQASGTTGGVGTYNVQVGTALSAGPEAMASKGVSWANMLAILSALPATLPQHQYSTLNFSSVGYTQGGAFQDSGTDYSHKVADLTAMLTDFDALSLHQGGLYYYLGLPAGVSNATAYVWSNMGTYFFVRSNAPGQGGPWSGRAFATAPAYRWPFTGADNIHTGDYGTIRWGEAEGYARHQVQDLNVAWTPLWRSLSASITVAGNTITIPFDRPAGADFANGVMSFQLGDDNAGGSIVGWASQMGFDVLDNGAETPVTPSISGMNILLTAAAPFTAGHTLEVSYAFYGPGGTNPGQRPGVWGNLVMTGPPSALFPGQTIDMAAWPFDERVTVQ